MENFNDEFNINSLYDELNKNKNINNEDNIVIDDDLDSKNQDCCSNCGSNNRIEKYGYFICMNCGTQTNLIIDSTLESRDYGPNDTKVRTSRCETFKTDISTGSNGLSSIIMNDNNSSSSIIKDNFGMMEI